MVSMQAQAAIAAGFDFGFHYFRGKTFSPFSMVMWYIPIVLTILTLNLLYMIFLYPKYFSPYKDLPAVPNPHWFWGNYQDYMDHKYDQAARMDKAYPGRIFSRFYGPLGQDVLIAHSVEAHIQILQTFVYKFVKPLNVSRGFINIIGNGLFFAEGNEHKYQRRIISPAFTYGHVRTLVPIFVEKIKMTVKIYDAETAAGTAVIKQLPLFSRLTLDAIGEASFGVNLHAIDNEDNELVKAYTTLSTPLDDPFHFFATGFIPGWKYVPTKGNKRMASAKAQFKKSCTSVLMQRVNDVYEKKVEGKDRDILSILLKDTTHKWEVNDIENQMMTFLLAGHETTAGATAWATYLLAVRPEMQQRLRDEVRTAFPGGIDEIVNAEQIEALPYLNNVARECFRFNPPVPITVREAIEDVYIEGVLVKKGTTVQISIALLNKSKQLWGPDAEEFNPDRWNASTLPAYGYSTFIHGARSCLGRRLAETEFKCILAAFVGRFQFDCISPDYEPMADFVVTAKPIDGMPLKITRIDGW
ncbi:cytochrome P450 [Lipomyces arxii]|uniref:cytochrome P450 n=1 Tax=Lipomyces arxii TaxID=56418 RepID=UPI0034CEFFA7